MSQANYLGTLQVSDDDGVTFEDLNGIKNFNPDYERDELDTTAYNDGDGWRDKLVGLRDFSLSMDGDYLAADTGQTIVRDAFLTGADDQQLLIRFAPDGVNGIEFPVKVVGMSGPSGGVGDLASTSFSFTGDGAISTF